MIRVMTDRQPVALKTQSYGGAINDLVWVLEIDAEF
jgi:hypothetical protein